MPRIRQVTWDWILGIEAGKKVEQVSIIPQPLGCGRLQPKSKTLLDGRRETGEGDDLRLLESQVVAS